MKSRNDLVNSRYQKRFSVTYGSVANFPFQVKKSRVELCGFDFTELKVAGIYVVQNHKKVAGTRFHEADLHL